MAPKTIFEGVLLAAIGAALFTFRFKPPQLRVSARELRRYCKRTASHVTPARAKMGGLVMDKFDLLMKGGAHGPVIIPGKSGESRMILMLEGKVQPRMPFGGDPLSASDIAIIKAWIDSGGIGPTGGED